MIPRILSIFVIVFAMAAAVAAQVPNPNASAPPRPEEPDLQTNSIREMLTKLQIDQAKKDFDEMLERGDEALKLSEQIQESFSRSGSLTSGDRQKLQELEKLVKKIRGELGGDDPDESETGEDGRSAPTDVVSTVKRLPDLAGRLVTELKKTTRFTISATAIQSSNAVLRAVRFLRSGK
ncbi:MAG: hypothetical protein ACK4S4_13700 [Pyrinomonadaceae bacterium]